MKSYFLILSDSHRAIIERSVICAALFSLVVAVSGCAQTASGSQWSTLASGKSSPFNEVNIDALHIGLLSNGVRDVFGAPDEVNTAVCGTATPSSWVCETWKYQRKDNRYSFNTFTFDVRDGVKSLNNWSVKRE